MSRGSNSKTPRSLQSFTGSLPISKFDFSKRLPTRPNRKPKSDAYQRYAQDVAAFIHEVVIIDDAQGDGELGTKPFHLWPAQAALLATITTERLILLLKARQLGITWLVLAYALWLGVFRAQRLVLIFSVGQNEANEMMRRIQAMYDRLPPALKAELPTATKRNGEEIAWGNGSRIQSLPSRATAGSGYTASLVILDEWAKNPNDRQLYTAVKPTIDGGGAMIELSSANGTGNLFYEQVERAQKGEGRFSFHFLPWTARPDRDAQWYAATAADAISEAFMQQEYPATANEAFAATNVERFLPSMLLWDACNEDVALPGQQPMVLALDAGEVDDAFSVIGVVRHPDRSDDIVIAVIEIFTPSKGIALDYDMIEGAIGQILDSHNVVHIAYDRYQLHQMAGRLSKRVWTQEFSQAGDRLVADKQLLDLIVRRGILHTGHVELRAHIDNADRQLSSDKRKFRLVKRSQSLKIDATVALSMAAYRCLELNLW